MIDNRQMIDYNSKQLDYINIQVVDRQYRQMRDKVIDTDVQIDDRFSR